MIKELNSIKALCSFAAQCHAEHVHVNREMLEKVLEKLEIADEALEILMLPPYKDSDLQSLIFAMNDIARSTLQKIRGGKE